MQDLTPASCLFTTIEQGLVVRVMGRLSAADTKTLREVLADVIG